MEQRQPESTITLQSLFKILRARKWYILTPMAVVVPLVTAWAFSLPDIYEANTTILITPQKVPVDYVRPTITSDIGDRVDIIIKQMLSYDRLGQIIDEFKLYPELVATKPREEIFYKMIREIAITPEESLTHPEGDSSSGKDNTIA